MTNDLNLLSYLALLAMISAPRAKDAPSPRDAHRQARGARRWRIRTGRSPSPDS